MLVTDFLIGLAISLALTPICRSVAHRFAFVAKPTSDRWHRRPTALFGGVSIAVTALVVGVWTGPDASLWPLLGAGTLIAGFGFVDDWLSLKPSTKLIAQVTVASILLFFGFRLQWTSSLVGDVMLTMFWIVGITNAFNLLDNMDGLCAGITLIAGSFLLIGFIGVGSASEPAANYLAALMGATAGFLVYNIHPASIFLGDTGSLFLGLNLAVLTLIAKAGPGRSGLLPVVATPVLLLLIPIFDTTLVTAMRILSGRRPSQGGRDHSSHRLVAVGLSEPRAVATLWVLAAAGGGSSLMLQRRDVGLGGIAAVMFLLAMMIFAVYLARVRVYGDASTGPADAVTPVVTNFMYKRRVAEVMLDLCLIPIAYYTAYRLRFEGDLFAPNYRLFLQSLPVIIASQLVMLFVVGGYRGVWRHFGMMDAVVFTKGVLLGTLAAQTIILYLYRFESYSRTVFVIDAGLLVMLLAGSRASFRLVSEFVLRRGTIGKRCLIYGMKGANLSTIREAFGTDTPLRIVGFIDDEPLHRNTRVGGVEVLGDYHRLLSLIEEGAVDCVVLNTHVADAERLQELEKCCGTRDIALLRLHVHLMPLSDPATS